MGRTNSTRSTGMKKKAAKVKLQLLSFGSGALVLAFMAVAFACTNYVGEFKVKGNYTNSGTVKVVGGEYLGKPTEDMTQTVYDDGPGPVSASALDNSPGFYVATAGNPSHLGQSAWRLGSTNVAATGTGLYDISVFAGTSIIPAYDDHYTWNNPDGDCMVWNIGSVFVSQLGYVQIPSHDGKIMQATNAADNASLGVDGNGLWGPFTLSTSNGGATATDLGSPKENGVCVGDREGTYDGQNGNQAPFNFV